MTYRMNAFWEWFYGTPAGYFSMEKSANMYIVHTKFIPQNCQCAQVYPVHRCRKIFRIQYRTWNLVNKINALHGHWSTHSLAKCVTSNFQIPWNFLCFFFKVSCLCNTFTYKSLKSRAEWLPIKIVGSVLVITSLLRAVTLLRLD